jgi:hypothetical protein
MNRAFLWVAKAANILVLLGIFSGCGQQDTEVETTVSTKKPAVEAGQVTGMRHSTDDTELAVRGNTTQGPSKQAALTDEGHLAACADYDYLSAQERAKLDSACAEQP